MFTTEELFSKKNQKMAFEHFQLKKDSSGSDGMRLSDLEQYWKMNQRKIIEEVQNQEYEPGVILIREYVNQKGKRRNIANLASIDRFITRLLAQKLNRYLSSMFLEKSFAYQEGKGVVAAVEHMKKYVEAKKKYVIEIDIKDFFDTIPLEKLFLKIKELIIDRGVLELIRKYLFCTISCDGRILQKQIGIIQGNSISPVLSNLYLHECDEWLENQNVSWVRYADNIYIFTETFEEAIPLYDHLCDFLTKKMHLRFNSEKSGIYEVSKRILLGYDIIDNGKSIDVRKHIFREMHQYSDWHNSKLEFLNGRYHILSDGIINKQDYSLLFENEGKKQFIPVEVTDQLNIYGNIMLASNVLLTCNVKGIRIAFFDKYGRSVGTFTPESAKTSAEMLLVQARYYLDEKARLDMARRMEIASLHNVRANLRYYDKKKKGELKGTVQIITEYIMQMNQCSSINEMMLIEARARQKYYATFNEIIKAEGFYFEKRTKRPPLDALNACISFGNTLLYNYFATVIWRKGIDLSFGIVHASNRRRESLNLDFADIFKPIIVDRVIFSAVNKKMLIASRDFEKTEEGGIYLTKEGKKRFLSLYEEKLNSKIMYKGKEMSYRQIMNEEVQQYKNELLGKGTYKPYKYY